MSDKRGETGPANHFLKEFFRTFGAFFRKPKIPLLLLFCCSTALAKRNW